MRLEFTLARRYLLGHKSHNAINIISGIAVGGITLATVALVIVLSVFNGFSDLLTSLYTEFDPVLKVVPTEGKFLPAEATLQKLKACPSVKSASRVIEDQALILFRGHPQVITVKGVDENFDKVSNIRHILFGEGTYQFERAGVDYAIPGMGLAQLMGGTGFPHMQICAPRGGERINLMDPLESLSVVEVDNTGVGFCVNQHKYDDNYLLVSYNLALELFEKQDQATALELSLKSSTNIDKAQQQIAAALGSKVRVLNRMEQQEGIFGIMQIEKLLAFIFLTFILLVACFNIVSSVSMLILEKKADVQTLSHLGLPRQRIARVFMLEGQLISLTGALVGIAVGSSLCLLQQYFGFIPLGTGDNFIIQSYPVSLHWQDLLAVLGTTIVTGSLSTWYPVHYFTKP